MRNEESAQATGQRWGQIRSTNYEEPVVAPAGQAGSLERPGASLVQEDYAETDTVAEGSADYGPALRVSGFERLTLFVTHTAGTTTTAVHIGVQTSSNGNDWHDLYADEAGTGVLVRKVFDLTTAADLAAAFNMPTSGRFMRFKVWTSGSNRSGSRVTLHARRIMDAS